MATKTKTKQPPNPMEVNKKPVDETVVEEISNFLYWKLDNSSGYRETKALMKVAWSMISHWASRYPPKYLKRQALDDYNASLRALYDQFEYGCKSKMIMQEGDFVAQVRQQATDLQGEIFEAEAEIALHLSAIMGKLEQLADKQKTIKETVSDCKLLRARGVNVVVWSHTVMPFKTKPLSIQGTDVQVSQAALRNIVEGAINHGISSKGVSADFFTGGDHE